jgi:hypothetical protein
MIEICEAGWSGTAARACSVGATESLHALAPASHAAAITGIQRLVDMCFSPMEGLVIPASV